MLFPLLSAILLSILLFFAFEKPNLKVYSDNLLLTSVYEKSDIDFDIPSPTKTQLNEIKELSFVDDVFGYYFTESNVSLANNKQVKTKILFSDMLDSLNFTMYNSSRLIDQTDNADNPLFIDYEFAKNNKMKLGDSLSFNNINFQVGRIYETNSYYGSAIFIPLVGKQKELIESISKSYSGAYLKVNDRDKADAYLRNYKPEGRLKDRNEFTSEEEYEYHYNSWKNANYYNEITSFQSRIESVSLQNGPSYNVGFAICFVLMSLVFVLLSLRKSELLYFKGKSEKKCILSYYIFSSFFDSVVSFGTIIGTLFIARTLIQEYIPFSYFTSMIISGSMFCFGLLCIDLIVSFVFYKKTLSNSK